MNTKLTVVSRQSKLALLQVEEVFQMLGNIPYELRSLKSYGDVHKNLSLLNDKIRPDFFTKELDDMLLNGEADIAIHSAKDLPYPLPQGLDIIALTKRADNTDSLVCRLDLPIKRLEDLPKGTVIGTSSAKRKLELEAKNPNLVLKSIRGTIEERIAQVDQGDYDAVIVATCALQRLGLENRISQLLDFQTHPLQGALAIVAKKGREDLNDLFRSIDARVNFGKAFLVGAGPGSSDLMTIRGKEALKKADIIYYDDLIDHDSLAEYKHAELVYVGKRKNVHHKEQGDINVLMVNSVYKGKNTVRLKGGDPMIFAHGGEEVEFLQSNLIDVEVVPGISTANALAALCKIPLTHREIASSLAFVTGHALYGLNIPKVDTLVFYMAGSKIKAIATRMIQEGWSIDTPVALIHNVSMPDQKEFYHQLHELSEEEKDFPTPVIIVIGKVVQLKFKAAKNICSEPNVLVTGLDDTAYKCLGRTIHTPLIEIQPLTDHTELNQAINRLSNFKNLLFTSKNTVEFFFKELLKLGKDSRDLHHLKIISIGQITSNELLKNGIKADYQAEIEDSYGVIDLFTKNKIEGSVLVPRSNIALDLIPNGLRENGYLVETVAAYQNVLPKPIHKVDLNIVDTIVFTSPSSVDHFIQVYGAIPMTKDIIVRGRTTYNHFEKLNYPMQKIHIFNKNMK